MATHTLHKAHGKTERSPTPAFATSHKRCEKPWRVIVSNAFTLVHHKHWKRRGQLASSETFKNATHKCPPTRHAIEYPALEDSQNIAFDLQDRTPLLLPYPPCTRARTYLVSYTHTQQHFDVVNLARQPTTTHQARKNTRNTHTSVFIMTLNSSDVKNRGHSPSKMTVCNSLASSTRASVAATARTHAHGFSRRPPPSDKPLPAASRAAWIERSTSSREEPVTFTSVAHPGLTNSAATRQSFSRSSLVVVPSAVESLSTSRTFCARAGGDSGGRTAAVAG